MSGTGTTLEARKRPDLTHVCIAAAMLLCRQLDLKGSPGVQCRNICTLQKYQIFLFFLSKSIIPRVALRTKQHLVGKTFTAREI